MDIKYLNDFYTNYNEDGRLLSKHGNIEFITTMKYIHEFLKPKSKILEVGAGTGRYAITLSREGFKVSARELIDSNINVFKKKLKSSDKLTIEQGNALDLSRYSDNSFDAVLLLGPMYHLYSKDDKIRALKEAKRVVKNEGLIFVAYCMNEATIISWGFARDGENMINSFKNNMFTEKFACISTPKELFELVRIEDINHLNDICSLSRLKIIGTDMYTNYIKEQVDAWSDEVYDLYIKYHFAICERSDLIGLSHHTLDILKKI